ncbi:MAG TPA: prolipoprotein diacylglyceryl transferase [Candidatus Andersenbacteria bacterium]|nr:prolipoprotein diacylglyceryl transferase [Candidatus Andersenbacteria bacterium]
MIEFFPFRTIAFAWGPVAIHWYGIMYAVAFWIAYAVLPHLGKARGLKLHRDQWTMLIVYGALGVLIGGRLGYVLFYEPSYFFSHPLELIAIWHGGMSSHGGFIGVALAVWIWMKKNTVSSLALFDIITVPAAIGLALGRVGNIVNQEFGNYPYYEALGDMAIAMICYRMLCSTKKGFTISTFLILYSVERFLLEYIRPQEWPYIAGLTRGQFLTIPIFGIGVLLFLYARAKPRTTRSS